MKITSLLMVGVGLLAFTSSTALAAKADGKKAKLIAKYDKNKNSKLDADEKETIRADYAKDKEGDLKAFDKDGDGKLSDAELDIKPGSGKAKEGAGKSKKKDAEKAKTDDGKTKKEDTAEKPKTDK